MLGFGITAKVDEGAIADIFSKVLSKSSKEELDGIGVDLSDIIVSNATFMIVLGIVAVIIAVFGFVGACCLIRWMLVVYAIVLIVLLLAEIGLIIFAAVYPNSFRDKIQETMFKTLKDGYKNGIYVVNSSHIIMPTGAVELAWDAVQFKEACCGAYNYSDYQSPDFNWNKQVMPSVTAAVVPISCCKKAAGAPDETPTKPDDFEDLQKCLDGEDMYINSKNCYEALKDSIEDFIDQYKYIAIGIAVGIAVIELLLIIFAFCLCRANDDKYV